MGNQQPQTNIRGWRDSYTRVAFIAEPASLTMITFLPLLTVYVGKFLGFHRILLCSYFPPFETLLLQCLLKMFEHLSYKSFYVYCVFYFMYTASN